MINDFPFFNGEGKWEKDAAKDIIFCGSFFGFEVPFLVFFPFCRKFCGQSTKVALIKRRRSHGMTEVEKGQERIKQFPLNDCTSCHSVWITSCCEGPIFYGIASRSTPWMKSLKLYRILRSVPCFLGASNALLVRGSRTFLDQIVLSTEARALTEDFDFLLCFNSKVGLLLVHVIIWPDNLYIGFTYLRGENNFARHLFVGLVTLGNPVDFQTPKTPGLFVPFLWVAVTKKLFSPFFPVDIATRLIRVVIN